MEEARKMCPPPSLQCVTDCALSEKGRTFGKWITLCSHSNLDGSMSSPLCADDGSTGNGSGLLYQIQLDPLAEVGRGSRKHPAAGVPGRMTT